MTSISTRLSLLGLVAIVAGASGCTIENRPPRSAPPPASAPVQSTTVVTSETTRTARHPAYLKALSDLREARANLERKGGDSQMRWDERDAIAASDRAIQEIKNAAIDDGKDLNDHPAVDVREPRSGRLHRALATLRQARTDIEHEEDTASSRGLRDRAIRNIDEAIRATEDGIKAAARSS